MSAAEPSRRVLSAAMVAAFLASIVPFGAPRFFELARLTAALAGTSMAERKVALFDKWYIAARQLRREIRPGATVDVVMLTPAARDIAVLTGAELQPRDCRFFDGWEAWRRRQRAEFLHDRRAANAAPGPPPPAAEVVIVVDPAADPPVQWRRSS